MLVDGELGVEKCIWSAWPLGTDICAHVRGAGMVPAELCIPANRDLQERHPITGPSPSETLPIRQSYHTTV